MIQLLFLHYFVAVLIVGICFLAGKVLNPVLVKVRQKGTPTSLDHSIHCILGLAVLLGFSGVAVLYLPAQIAYILFGWVWLSAGVYSVFRVWQYWQTPADYRKILSFLGVFFISFVLTYLPFIHCNKIFLASESGGDLSAYLGDVKMYFHRSPEDPLFQPRLWNMLDIKKSYLSGNSDYVVYDQIEPAEAAFHVGMNPATYTFMYFLAALKRVFPLELLYMAFILGMRSIIPIIACLTVPKAIPHPWRAITQGVIFAALCISAALQSTLLNHAVLQLVNLLLVLGAFQILLRRFEQPESPAELDLFRFGFLGIVIAMTYFAALPWFVGIGLLYILVSWRTHSLPRFQLRQQSGRRVVALLGAIGMSSFPYYIETFLRLKDYLLLTTGKVSAERLMSETGRLGPAVRSVREFLVVSQGAISHYILPPFTDLNLTNLISFRYGWFFYVVAVFAITGMTGVVWLPQFARNQEVRTIRPYLTFFSGTFLLTFVLELNSRGYTYTFDKAATLSLPLAVPCWVSSLVLCAYIFRNIYFRRLLQAAFALGGVVWISGLLQARMYQVKSFWNGTDRTAIIYTDFLNRLPFESPSKSFLYSKHRVGTDYFLLDAASAGLRPLPLNQYAHSTEFSYFLKKIDLNRANFLIPRKDGHDVDAVSLDFFKFPGRNDEFVVPMSPYLDLRRSHLPLHAELDREAYLGLAINSKHAVEVVCRLANADILPSIEVTSIDQNQSSIRWESGPREKGSDTARIVFKPESARSYYVKLGKIKGAQVRSLE